MAEVFFLSLTILAAFALILVLGFLRVVLTVPSNRWAEASELSGGTSTVLFGEVESDRDGLPDPRVAKGKVWDDATKQWLPQGKLSDEYLNSLAS